MKYFSIFLIIMLLYSCDKEQDTLDKIFVSQNSKPGLQSFKIDGSGFKNFKLQLRSYSSADDSGAKLGIYLNRNGNVVDEDDPARIYGFYKCRQEIKNRCADLDIFLDFEYGRLEVKHQVNIQLVTNKSLDIEYLEFKNESIVKRISYAEIDVYEILVDKGAFSRDYWVRTSGYKFRQQRSRGIKTYYKTFKHPVYSNSKIYLAAKIPRNNYEGDLRVYTNNSRNGVHDGFKLKIKDEDNTYELKDIIFSGYAAKRLTRGLAPNSVMLVIFGLKELFETI